MNRDTLKRLPLLAAALLLAGGAGPFIVRHFLATSLIAYGEDAASRDLAVSYAPASPEVLAARGKYRLYRAEPAQPAEGLADLARAAALSPRDYRFPLELGRAYEQAGDAAAAGAALDRAVALAPRYFDARWARANFLLRAGKLDAALDEFREAIALSGRDVPNERATMNIYAAVRGAVGDRLEALRRITPPGPVPATYLASFLTGDGRVDDALGLWRELPAAASESYRELTVRLLGKLEEQGRFADAREVWAGLKRILPGGAPGADPGRIENPGFERAPVGERAPELVNTGWGFDWVLRRHPEVRLNRSRYDKHGGAYALNLSFAASMSIEFDHAFQVVAVEPGRSYRLGFYVKTRNAPADERKAPYVEITDVVAPVRLTVRAALPTGDANWQAVSATFAVPPETHGLRIAIRSPRVNIDLARMTDLWFDDFTLEEEAK